MNRKVYIYIFVWIIFCVFKLNAQVGEIFNNYIPKIYLNDPDSKEMVYDIIDELCNVDPSLVYFYLEFLKQTELKSTKAKDAFGLFNYERNNTLKKIEEWVQEEIEIVNENSISFSQWLSYYHELYFFASSPNKFKPYNTTYPVDNNFRYFIVYLYYNKQSLDYNKDFDYESLIQDLFKVFITEFNYVYENAENVPTEELKLIQDKAEGYPFLFKDSYFDFIKNQAEIRYTSFMLKLSSILYLENGEVLAGIGLQIKEEIKENFNYTYIDGVELSGELIHNIKNNNYLSAGFKLPLKKYKSYLSYILLNIQYQIYSLHNNIFNNKKPGKFYNIVKISPLIGALVETDISVNNLSNISWNSIFVRAAAPLLYLDPNVLLELGITLDYTHFNYDFEINRNEKPVFYDPSYSNYLPRTLTEKFSSKYNKVRARPSLSLIINISKIIDVRIAALSFWQIPLLEVHFNYNL